MNKIKFIQASIAFFALILFMGCSSTQTGQGNKGNKASEANSESEISKIYLAEVQARALKNSVPITPQGAKFIPNAFDSEGKVIGYRCVSLFNESTNPLSKAGIQVDDVVC